MRVAGLTGGIACGKTTVSQALRASGVVVVDCDTIAHDVARKGCWGYRRIVKEFGRSILLATGELDREALGQLVFQDAAARRRLNRATHLPVAVALVRALAWHWLTFQWVVVVDMPLLFETGMNRWLTPVIVVHCSREQQQARLIARNSLDDVAAVARIEAQMPVELKVAQADIDIENNGSLQELVAAAQQLSHRLQAREGRWWRGLLTSPLAAGLVLVVGWKAVSRALSAAGKV